MLLLWVLQVLVLASLGVYPMKEVKEHVLGSQTTGSLAPPGGQRASCYVPRLKRTPEIL